MISVLNCFFYPLGYIILNLVHGLFNLYLLVYSWFHECLNRTQFFSRKTISSLYEEENDYISKVKLFNKIPKHIVFIVGSESVCYNDLVKLISWCSQFGIQFTTLYHFTNGIEPMQLYMSFYKNYKERARKIMWEKSFEDIKQQVELHLNGYKRVDPSEQLRVNIITSNEGIDSLVEIAKEGQINRVDFQSNLTINNIDDRIRKKLPFPEPDVAVVFGDTCCSFGFSPWHLRVTEFVYLPSHHNISQKDFLYLLNRYNNCEQRFGK